MEIVKIQKWYYNTCRDSTTGVLLCKEWRKNEAIWMILRLLRWWARPLWRKVWEWLIDRVPQFGTLLFDDTSHVTNRIYIFHSFPSFWTHLNRWNRITITGSSEHGAANPDHKWPIKHYNQGHQVIHCSHIDARSAASLVLGPYVSDQM